MKKTLANIRTLAALLIASATLVACSNDDSAIIGEQPAQQQAPQVYTLTLQAGKADNAQTRALDLDGTKLVAKWVAGEEVTVTKGTTSLGTLSVKEGSVSADGQTCTFTGTLTGTIATDDVLTLTYHPMASLAAYASQTGTLESASACDMATASVTVTAVDNGTNTITAGTATFATQTAMLKITMQDTGLNKINATKLQVSAANGTTAIIFSFSPTADTYADNGDGILYFALPNAASVQAMLTAANSDLATFLTSATVSFTVTKGDESYTINTEKKYIFEGGKYYATTLTKPAPTLSLTSPAVGQVIGSDGKNYAAASVPSGVTKVAMIAYVSGSNGLAIALADEGSLNWETAKSTCEAKTPAFTGGTWKLPTQAEWNQMFSANGGSEDSYTGLNTAITTAGGTTLQEEGGYWSSTVDGSFAYYVRLQENETSWRGQDVSGTRQVRACLAF